MALAKRVGGIIVGPDWVWPSQLSYECFKAYNESAAKYSKE